MGPRGSGPRWLLVSGTLEYGHWGPNPKAVSRTKKSRDFFLVLFRVFVSSSQNGFLATKLVKKRAPALTKRLVIFCLSFFRKVLVNAINRSKCFKSRSHYFPNILRKKAPRYRNYTPNKRVEIKFHQNELYTLLKQ